MQYVYETISISSNIWTGKSSDDYLDIINQQGAKGWRFICFAPSNSRPKGKGISGIELVFEKPVSD